MRYSVEHTTVLALLLYRGEAAMEDLGLEPMTSCMPCKRKNRRKSVISNESRRLSHLIVSRIGDILLGW